MALLAHPPCRRPVLVLAFLLLPACGGGGGGGGAPAAPLAELAALAVSTGSLSPAFSARSTEYVVGSALLDPTVRVTPTAKEAGATIDVRGIATASGAASFPIPLPPGATPVAVTVTSADGALTTTYTIVFVRGAPSGQEAFVKASNTDADDIFGGAVALERDTLVVGAPGEDGNARGENPGSAAEDDDSAGESGAVYVYVRSGGTWVKQAYLKASNADAQDLFGAAVAISGDTIVVGAPGESSAGRGTTLPGSDPGSNAAGGAGAAYVFVRRGTIWSEQAYLKASNAERGDEFGSAVAISGDTVVVGSRLEASAGRGVNPGATAEANNGAGGAGAAYVFVRTGTTWAQEAFLKASNTEASDDFGRAVAISKDTIAVSAFTEDGAGRGVNPGNGAEFLDGANRSGAVFVFERTGSTWTQQAYLKASNTDADDFFGNAAALSGNTLVITATGEDSAARGVNPGATAEEDDSAPAAGAAYVFERTGGVWVQQAYLKASNAETDDVFGSGVAIDGDVIVVGASFEDGSRTGVNPGAAAEEDDGAPDAGAAYVFLRAGGVWSQVAYLKASNPGESDDFSVVAVSGDTVVVGARGERSGATGVNPGPAAEADDSRFAAGAVYTFR